MAATPSYFNDYNSGLTDLSRKYFWQSRFRTGTWDELGKVFGISLESPPFCFKNAVYVAEMRMDAEDNLLLRNMHPAR